MLPSFINTMSASRKEIVFCKLREAFCLTIALVFIFLTVTLLSVHNYIKPELNKRLPLKHWDNGSYGTPNHLSTTGKPDALQDDYENIHKGIWQIHKLNDANNTEDIVFSMYAYYDDRPRLEGNIFFMF